MKLLHSVLRFCFPDIFCIILQAYLLLISHSLEASIHFRNTQFAFRCFFVFCVEFSPNIQVIKPTQNGPARNLSRSSHPDSLLSSAPQDNPKSCSQPPSSVVIFISALICPFFLVDFIVRKQSLSLGIIIQFISMLYITIFLTVVPSVTEGVEGVKSESANRVGTGATALFISVGWWA